MSIEVGSKWVKDGEVVEIFKITTAVTHDEVIFFTCKKGINHVLFDYDFLEQYKPYEEPKQTVMIEKWLVEGRALYSKEKHLQIVETSNINAYIKFWGDYKKIKLICTYEVPL